MTRLSDRRDFIGALGTLAGGAWLSTCLPATAAAAVAVRDAAAGFVVFTPAEAATLEALADRILPGGDTPGASEAGAIWFIDAAMQGFMHGALPAVRAAIGDLDARAVATGAASFAALAAADRDLLMPAIAAQSYFNLLHLLTMAGVMSMPGLGGNHDRVGWTLIGFDPRHVWRPPFGAYDNRSTEQST